MKTLYNRLETLRNAGKSGVVGFYENSRMGTIFQVSGQGSMYLMTSTRKATYGRFTTHILSLLLIMIQERFS
jgi:hypothetical protein